MPGKKEYILFLYLSVLSLICNGQQYIVERASFSSRQNDEFSPVVFPGGLVFCANIRDNNLAGYSAEGSRVYSIFYVQGNDTAGWKRPSLLSKDLTSGFNDGPATFSTDGKTVYFSRNNNIEYNTKNVSDTVNRLGIYSAGMIDGEWTDIKPFLYNDSRYTFATPSVSPEGTRLYFSSDMPGGRGGMDLYYCDLGENGWSRPVNMGSSINTAGNESFPYACRYNKLYFSSDGHPGFGMKDIYYTNIIEGSWIPPVHLDTLINTPWDDFGICIDSTFEKGYFSSRRLLSDDIFSFRMPPVNFSHCDTVREDNFCFTFYDERRFMIDTIPVNYIWQFDDTIVKHGVEVRHCFPGPGKYNVKLTITDAVTGDTISDRVGYDVGLEKIQQGYIKAPGFGDRGSKLTFDGREINLKDFNVTEYFWDFGDGFKPGGEVVENEFRQRGEYYVKMGLVGGKDSEGELRKKCYLKKINIL